MRLSEAGDGVRSDANKGTPMKEWFSLDPESGRAWRSSPARPWISPAPVADTPQAFAGQQAGGHHSGGGEEPLCGRAAPAPRSAPRVSVPHSRAG